MCQINSYLLISESPSTIETCDSVVACSFNSWGFPRKKSSFTVILSTIMPVSARSLSKTPFWNGNLLISCWVRAVQQSWGLYYHALCGFFWFVLFSLFFSFWCFFGCCFLSTIENCKEIFPWALMGEDVKLCWYHNIYGSDQAKTNTTHCYFWLKAWISLGSRSCVTLLVVWQCQSSGWDQAFAF